MKAQKQIEVYLINKRNIKPIYLVQYDTGIQLVFDIVDFNIPSGTSATLYVQKPSGKFVYQEKGITVVGNKITIDLENQAIAEHGNNVGYQVQLKDGTDLITTFAGIFRVEKSLKDAGATESKTVISAFEAKTAEQIAEIEAAAQEQIEVIRNLYNTYATKNETAYAIKGNLSGVVVAAGDVSPLEHNLVVKVHGKNRVPFGTISFTKNQSYLLDNPLPAGTYTISANITSSDTDSVYSAVSINNKSEVMKYIALKRGVRVSSTFTVDKPITNIDFCAAYNYAQGESDSATWADIQLEEGTVATEYTPYLDISTVKVTRFGKNLWRCNSTFPKTISGVTVEYDAETQTYTFNGTSTAAGDVHAMPNNENIMHIRKGETLCIKMDVVGGTIDGSQSTESKLVAFINTKDYGNSMGTNTESRTSIKTFTEDAEICKMYFYMFGAGIVFKNFKVRVQVEIGSVATAFEPYNGAEYIPAADGTVSGITSISPYMNILTDTAGAIVECEYNVDTKAYINKMLKSRKADVELLSSAWVATEYPFMWAQVINIEGSTKYTKVKLNPSMRQIAVFYEKNLAFGVETVDGVITAYAIGQKPMNDYVIQAEVMEVSV